MRINSSWSIWQYAKKAGLRTVYIDAQRTGGNLQNLMNDAEKKDIDEFVQFDQTSVRDRDMAAAKLIDLLNDGQPQLVVINKVGAHFPVHDKYPDAFMAYRPTLPRGQFVEVAETGKRDGFSYNIFPTLLQLMGYDLAGVEAVYGKPLSVPTADEFTFNYRFNARLGAKPQWKHIDLKSIVTPRRRRRVWRRGSEFCS